MNQPATTIVSKHESDEGSVRNYLIGFGLSLLVTLTAYVLTTHHNFSMHVIEIVLACLAAIQFIVQLLFFLHLGRESKPRWRLYVFIFMLGVVVIVVGGSLWIMNNLNYRMTPQQTLQYMNNQDGL